MPFLIMICSRQCGLADPTLAGDGVPRIAALLKDENRGHILTFNSWLNLDVVKM